MEEENNKKTKKWQDTLGFTKVLVLKFTLRVMLSK